MIRFCIRALGFVIVTVWAPSATAQNPRAPIVRDSAGVRIVEHRTIRGLPIAFRIAEKPSLDLGGLQDDLRAELDWRSPFHHASRLSDGRIVVADHHVLKLFDSRGKVLRVIGRQGQGPGEFGQLRQTCILAGDTIVAINFNVKRVSVFTRTGEHVRTFVVDGYVPRNGCLGDGTLLLTDDGVPAPGSVGDRGMIQDRSTTVRHMKADGTVIGTIGNFPGASLDVTFPRTINLVPYTDSIYAGDGRTAELGLYTMSGKVARLIRWNDPLVKVTEEMVRARTGQLRGQPQRSSGPLPPTSAALPAYRAIKVDSLGRVWVEAYQFSDEPPEWVVFDKAGALLGRVSLPKVGTRTELVTVGRDEVTLRWWDDDGAVHLSLHPLVR